MAKGKSNGKAPKQDAKYPEGASLRQKAAIDRGEKKHFDYSTVKNIMFQKNMTESEAKAYLEKIHS